jgi:hypothetical protein
LDSFNIIANLACAKLVWALWGSDLNGRPGVLGQMTQFCRAPTIRHAFGVDDAAHNRILSGDYFIKAKVDYFSKAPKQMV